MIKRRLSVLAALAVFMLSGASTYSQAQSKRTTTMTEITKETQADEAHNFEEYNAVAEALQPYIESATTGDSKIIRTPFYDHAHIVGSINGEFRNADLDAFEQSIEAGGPSPDVKHHIAWIDISGNAAAAKVEFINWRGFRFTDFFVLFKNDGVWKISGKVFDSHSNS